MASTHLVWQIVRRNASRVFNTTAGVVDDSDGEIELVDWSRGRALALAICLMDWRVFIFQLVMSGSHVKQSPFNIQSHYKYLVFSLQKPPYLPNLITNAVVSTIMLWDSLSLVGFLAFLSLLILLALLLVKQHGSFVFSVLKVKLVQWTSDGTRLQCYIVSHSARQSEYIV